MSVQGRIGQDWRLIALDLDGTVLRNDKSLSARNRRALLDCAKAGVILVIASGRAYTSLPEEMLSLTGVRYAITSNGAAVYDTGTGERILHIPLKEEGAAAVLRLIREKGEQENCQPAFEVFVEGVPYAPEEYVRDPRAYGASQAGAAYVQRTRRPVKELWSFAWEHRSVLDSIDVIVGNPRERERLLEKLGELPGLYVTSSVPHLLEIAHEQAGKGAALSRLARRLGILKEQIIAFGNEENDVDMLTFAGLGAAVANSPEHVQMAADRVTASNEEDGVACLLEELLY